MARERRREEVGDSARGRAPDRSPRIPKGPSFATTVGFGAGIGGAVLAFLATFFVSVATTSDPGEAMDAAGVQAVRMLAAPGADRWKENFGSTAAARQKAIEILQTKLASFKDDRERDAVSKAIDEFRAGRGASGAEWRPGLDMVLPPADPGDQLLEASRKNAIRDVQASAPDGFVGAAVQSATRSSIHVSWGTIFGTDTPVRTVGDTRIFAVSMGAQGTARQYEHPMKGRDGSVQGWAVLAVSAAGLKAPSPMAAAGAAGAAAFVGAFLVGFLAALGPVKAIRKLAQDAEAVAGGATDTRITPHGPDVVQAVARNLQKITQAMAAGVGAAPAEPQIVEQQVYVQPVAEVQEGLGPLRSFRRPEEFEIEATQKTCPDLGNDFYDLVNVDDDHVGLFVADIPNVSGVRGALYMAQVRALLRAWAPEERSPAEVLKRVNRGFAGDLPRGLYVTAVYAVVNRTTGVCTVASAQHLPLVFWKLAKKASARVACEGIALGLDAGAVFEKTISEKSIQLERGDRVVLYTDGAINSRNAAGVQYGEERFYYVLNRESAKNSAACVNLVANDMDLFHEGAPQMDDFTIVTLRRMR